MAYTKYSLTPADNNAAPPNGAPEGMLPSAVNDTMRDMMSQIRDVGDGIRGGTYTMTAPIITGGTINGATIGATTASTGKFSAVTNSALTSGRVTYAGTAGVLQDDADFTFNGTTVTMANDASISGLTVGKGGGAVASNTAVGNNALVTNTTGSANTAVGIDALRFATTSGANTALGYFSLKAATTGDGNNTALGVFALTANTTGSFNTATGRSALLTNTTGTNNSAYGVSSLALNTTGSFNTAVGQESLTSSTTASQNTAVGYQAGYSNTTGTELTAIGYQALKNSTGNSNTAVGWGALFTNTSGASNNAIGSGCLYSNTTGIDNNAMGLNALTSNTTGSYNVGIGRQALQANTTASNNTAVGYQAGYANTTGPGNTIFGYQAGLNNNNSVGYNTLLGYGAGSALTNATQHTIIGAYNGNTGGLDIRTASNYIVLSDGAGNPRIVVDNNAQAIFGGVSFNANSSVTISSLASNGCTAVAATTSATNAWRFYNPNGQVGSISMSASLTIFSTTSDYRLKTVIGAVADAGQRIDALEPIEYDWKAGGRTRGFLAHKFAEVYPTSVNGEKDAVDEEGKPIYQGMQASTPEVMADLIAEIQSLRKRVATLESK